MDTARIGPPTDWWADRLQLGGTTDWGCFRPVTARNLLVTVDLTVAACCFSTRVHRDVSSLHAGRRNISPREEKERGD
ncbi:hypothetical protein B296_00020352, partial [Ensete ventricosum]